MYYIHSGPFKYTTLETFYTVNIAVNNCFNVWVLGLKNVEDPCQHYFLGTKTLSKHFKNKRQNYKAELLHNLTHRLTQPRCVVTDLYVAVEKDVGVRAPDKLEHLDPEHGLRTQTVLQDIQGLCVGQHWAAIQDKEEKEKVQT